MSDYGYKQISDYYNKGDDGIPCKVCGHDEHSGEECGALLSHSGSEPQYCDHIAELDPTLPCGPDCLADLPLLIDDATGREHDECP